MYLIYEQRAVQSHFEGGSATARPTTTTPQDAAAVPSRPRPPQSRLQALLSWPFSLVWAILSYISRFVTRPAIASTAQRQDARSVADRFLREFEAKYGEQHLDFFQGGYSQCLEIARRELRLLLVILQSDEHDDTDEFCRNTVASDELIEYVRQNNVLVWGGNVREAEAFQALTFTSPPKKVGSTLQATAYPFMAIIGLQVPNPPSTTAPKMTVMDRLEGLLTPASVIRRFDSVIERYGATLNRLRLERDQRDKERQLREEQDRAYQDSLRADQEKERQAREKREAAARAEEEAQRAEEERRIQAMKREQYIQWVCRHLPEEPSADYEGEVTKLSFRLADGERVIRKFRGDESLDSLYKFVEAYPVLKSHADVSGATEPEEYHHTYSFTIHSPFPRTVYHADHERKLSDEKSLWPTATLIVDNNDDAEE
ncbi:uncharacterized protein BYT42DRAFT_544127 [Radiomyces spectabilis]|uniref:uncharacterized protein n=1 Tax=Radiomyces spectabilis TaxID=64574 RepID=UPI0022206791|nr:uncharacterized protein BYT42DRAFT_544127 [Radiomyces spectabilis]KAI8388915.1 hypothetical protein BYT42DRAFT_544127 [Radiomyces spectabilis]